MNNDDNKQLNNEAPVEEIKEDAENVEVVPEEQVGIIKEVDLNRVSTLILQDVRKLGFGKISFDLLEDFDHE